MPWASYSLGHLICTLTPQKPGAQRGKDLLNLTQPGGQVSGGPGRSETDLALCPSGLPGEGSLLPGPLAKCLLGSQPSQEICPPSTLFGQGPLPAHQLGQLTPTCVQTEAWPCCLFTHPEGRH